MKTASLHAFLMLSALVGLTFLLALPAAAQKRDYLTEAEIELVRDAQEIDRRIDVLTKAINRRLMVLRSETTEPSEKDGGRWGEAPQGTRLQLFGDIEKILQKAIDDLDDVAARNRDSKLFPKAVHKLSDACRQYIPQMRTFLDSSRDEQEKGRLLSSIEHCNNIAEAAATVPKEAPKEEKKKKN